LINHYLKFQDLFAIINYLLLLLLVIRFFFEF